ncbi:hypothetical protein L7Q16_06695, partial [Aeromonas veronii bv. sobria]|uniref:hypothetical protein n=1 Tax=Aeromonas veronii TaxID=654 RepID=UPI003CE4C04D
SLRSFHNPFEFPLTSRSDALSYLAFTQRVSAAFCKQEGDVGSLCGLYEGKVVGRKNCGQKRGGALAPPA